MFLFQSSQVRSRPYLATPSALLLFSLSEETKPSFPERLTQLGQTTTSSHPEWPGHPSSFLGLRASSGLGTRCTLTVLTLRSPGVLGSVIAGLWTEPPGR